MIQLEFDLWVEERVTDHQLATVQVHSYLFWLLQRRDVERFASPAYPYTVLRYKV